MIDNREFAYLRIAFGLVWLIDAGLKWEPTFRDNFVLPMLNIHSPALGIVLALVETLLALALIFGIFTRAALIGGSLLSLSIWVFAERFGEFWLPGSTDIGVSAGCLLVFAALWMSKSWENLSLDKKYQ